MNLFSKISSMFHTSNSQPPLSSSILFYLSLHLLSKIQRKTSSLTENHQIHIESNQGLLRSMSLWPSDAISRSVFSCSRALRQIFAYEFQLLLNTQNLWWPHDYHCSPELLSQISLVPIISNTWDHPIYEHGPTMWLSSTTMFPLWSCFLNSS